MDCRRQKIAMKKRHAAFLSRSVLVSDTEGAWRAMGPRGTGQYPAGPSAVRNVIGPLPDRDPVTSPSCVFIVTVLQFVMRGCGDSGRTAGIVGLGDAGPGVPPGEVRPLSH